MQQAKVIIEANTGTNPLLAIVLAIAIAAAMVTVTTLNFLNSGAYTTVKQIQIGIQTTDAVNQSDLDIISPINAADIDKYVTTLEQRLNTSDNYEDFGPEAVSDTALGL